MQQEMVFVHAQAHYDLIMLFVSLFTLFSGLSSTYKTTYNTVNMHVLLYTNTCAYLCVTRAKEFEKKAELLEYHLSIKMHKSFFPGELLIWLVIELFLN